MKDTFVNAHKELSVNLPFAGVHLLTPTTSCARIRHLLARIKGAFVRAWEAFIRIESCSDSCIQK